MRFRKTAKFATASGLLLSVLATVIPAPAAAHGAEAKDFFTIVHLSDTQYYSEQHPAIFRRQTEWVAANAEKEHIVFVTHTGDVVQNGGTGNAGEWTAANAAMSILDGAVPWGAAPGNHDYDEVSGPFAPATEFVKRFGPARFRNAPWYGGYSANGINSYQIISYRKWKLLILHLEADAPDESIEWARSVLAKNPGPPVILSTHIYLHDRDRARAKSAYFRRGGNSGEEVFRKLVHRELRIFLVLSGHWAKRGGEHHQFSSNERGAKVAELMADYQARPRGGDGWLRLLKFIPSKKTIEVRTYSPLLDRFENDPDSRFEIPWDPDGNSRRP
jgi:hypothetical protein